MRARQPDQTGTVDRDGVHLAYEVFDPPVPDAPTVLMMPPWAIVHSGVWKAQVPVLARRYRVVVFDPRGNGASDRPAGRDQYTDDVLVEDAIAVMDATDTARAGVVGLSRGGRFTALLAARHPDRVDAMALVAPSIPLSTHPRFSPAHFLADHGDDPQGWEKFSAAHWLRDYPDFVEFFMSQVFVEPHASKPREDAVAWALQTTGQVLLDTMNPVGTPDELRAMLASIRCPVLVVQGSEDTITEPAWSREVAAITGAELLEIEGAGHAPNARDPVVVNRALLDFLDRTLAGPRRPPRRRVRGSDGRRRVLVLSSPIGLGHVRRDMAIVDELRERSDGLVVEWLSQSPVTEVLERAGEVVHPASRYLASESSHLAGEGGEHDLHVFQAFRDMDEILVANFHVFQDVVEDGQYDLVVADEAWDVDHFWHEHPDLKRAPLAWLTDFVGFLPMPDGGDHEVALAADHNAEMLAHVERFARVRDRAIFVGDREDVVPDTFGPGLPRIRDWTEAHFDFAGYITGFDPATVADRDRLRRELGYGTDEPVCVVTVGGSGVGGHLLQRMREAHVLARRGLPDLRTVLVTGPRIDPKAVPGAPGLDVRGYVPDLYRHLAASDLAVVQGGLTTTMELTAAQRPFLYVPLLHHFEQQRHVRHRLERHRAGRYVDARTADPDWLAEAVTSELGRPVDHLPVDGGGAARAADLLAQLL